MLPEAATSWTSTTFPFSQNSVGATRHNLLFKRAFDIPAIVLGWFCAIKGSTGLTARIPRVSTDSEHSTLILSVGATGVSSGHTDIFSVIHLEVPEHKRAGSLDNANWKSRTTIVPARRSSRRRGKGACLGRCWSVSAFRAQFRLLATSRLVPYRTGPLRTSVQRIAKNDLASCCARRHPSAATASTKAQSPVGNDPRKAIHFMPLFFFFFFVPVRPGGIRCHLVRQRRGVFDLLSFSTPFLPKYANGARPSTRPITHSSDGLWETLSLQGFSAPRPPHGCRVVELAHVSRRVACRRCE
ncbi:hypothetical protein BC567DRAFT_23225 [Phyllosticta citribraziliensis]